jgi:restriction system protein
VGGVFRWGWNGRGPGPGTDSNRVLASLREMPWEGYRALVADIFRRRGHVVFEAEGPDSDVIDWEVSYPREIGGFADLSCGPMSDGRGRLIVNCQLRGMSQIPPEPLEEMVQVAGRNGADAALLVTDGDFSAEARRFAEGRSLILVDGGALFELVLELTLGDERDRRLGARLAKLFSGPTVH